MECCKEHTICRPWQSDELFYPSRVLDVGSLGDAYIRLRDTRTHSAEGPYFCLSHRWGGKQPFVLTRATLPILQNGTLLRELPKTFRDAILVTRKFRVRYLWYVMSTGRAVCSQVLSKHSAFRYGCQSPPRAGFCHIIQGRHLSYVDFRHCLLRKQVAVLQDHI